MKTSDNTVLFFSMAFVISTPIFLTLLSFTFIAFDESLYHEQFALYGIYDTLRDFDIERVNHDVLAYIQGNADSSSLDTDFFTEREIAHFADVRILIANVMLFFYSIAGIWLFSLVAVLLLSIPQKTLLKSLGRMVMRGSLLTLILAGIFFLISLTNFTDMFDTFHQGFFESGTYTFDPATERIVVLYPEPLFLDILSVILQTTLIVAGVLLLVSWILGFARRLRDASRQG